ncbi:hypothetical protein AVI51_15115 [Piscirickettsia salmonis]|uniref:Uncharacterized protein n=1 Tax=Piscirickettsia salmonis TaxID=1238 RepID=A0A9Q5VC43_PISSA|nr:hypothetical protein [Piscirickettsia salmonis]ALA24361.1 hypothetical protein KW89_893 [Piscirickettsia salmonis]APS44733.1 hypothetical protein AVI48_10400 [Piscirickettsia salmonis]APS48093.1 hypothetical protein AVI49_11005 [Piscirickettsia salmonis]APS52049.1 hypothetical protein AVI50_15270 [Piscirickettsia salmonis]APS55267.1 hypothetical protein AVI51_15115 [Piscirickettsia salmonis]
MYDEKIKLLTKRAVITRPARIAINTILLNIHGNTSEIENLKIEMWTSLLRRHLSGAWGNICDEDKELNDIDVEKGGRLLSKFNIEESDFYVITEAAGGNNVVRPLTTILLEEEY